MYEEHPGDFPVRTYGKIEKERILAYMRSFEPYAVAGLVIDCKTGVRTQIENVGFHDGVFFWSNQDIYHIERYHAAVCEDFIRMLSGETVY